MPDLPIACTLDPSELGKQRTLLLPGLVADADERQTLEHGYRLRFDIERVPLQRIADMIDRERRCCRFLRFQLTVEPDLGQAWLDLTGPPGTREFLEALFEAS